MNKIIALCVFAVMLLACGEAIGASIPKSHEWYMENPKAHNAKLKECKEKSALSQDCMSALQAKRRIDEGEKLSYKSVEWYMKNPKARNAKLKECGNITFKSMNADCKNAGAAEDRVKQTRTKK